MVSEIVTFRVRHDGPLAQYTKAHPHLQLAVWCNLNYDVYELTGAQPSDADELASTLVTMPRSAAAKPAARR